MTIEKHRHRPLAHWCVTVSQCGSWQHRSSIMDDDSEGSWQMADPSIIIMMLSIIICGILSMIRALVLVIRLVLTPCLGSAF